MRLKKILFSSEVFVIFLCLTLYVWYTIATTDRQKQNQITEVNANQVKSGIESFVNEKISILMQVRNFWLNSETVTHERFLAFCKEIIGQTPGFQGIEFESSVSKTVWIEPFIPADSMTRLDESSESLRQVTMQRAVRDRAVKITPALDFLEGGKGFIAIVPIFRRGEFEGTISGFFKTDTVFDLIFGSGLRLRYHCMIYDGNKSIFATEGATPESWLKNPFRVAKTLELRDSNWTLRLWPKEYRGQGGVLGVAVLIFGLGLSIVLSSLVWILTSKAELADVYAAMLEASRALNTSNDLSTLLRTTADACLRMTEVDRCCIFWWNATARRFEPAWISGGFESYLERFMEFKPSYGESLVVDKLVDHKQSLVLSGPESLAGFSPSFVTTYRIKSLMIVPLVSKGNLVGAITLDEFGKRHRFASREQSMIEGVANHAATAFENARLLAEAQKQSDVIATKNKELESLLTVLSEDLKNPLLSLHGMTRLLKDECGAELSESGKHYLGRIYANVLQMEDLLNDVLDFCKIGRTEDGVEEIDVPAVLEGVLAELKARRDTCSVELINNNQVDRVSYNRAGFRHILMSLIDNAIKFSAYQDNARVVIRSERRPAETLFTVKDNGIGIEKQHHDCIFDLFHRLGDLKGVEGIGVGLAIVKRVVEKYGGSIWLESEKGKGTTVFVSIMDKAPSP